MRTMNDQSYRFAAFDDRGEAEEAVDELHQAGFSHEDVGLMIRGSDAILGGTITDAQATKDPAGGAEGFIAGGVIGGILGAAGMLLIPGAGPVLASGVLAAALGGAAAGAATGGLLGAFTGLGISETEAQKLENEFQSGQAIVAVRHNGRDEEACAILRRHGGRFAGPQTNESAEYSSAT